VSVIIPAYNRGHLIGRALRSVLAQTVPVAEVIVVDDGSDDDTARIVEAIAATEPSVIYVRQDRAGAPAARNRGISMATGSLIAFQDSDDEWEPTFIEELTRYHVEPKTVAFCSLRTITGGGTTRVMNEERISNVVSRLRETNCISTQTALVDASLFVSHRFDEHLPRLQDWDLWLGMVGEARFIHHPNVLAIQYLQSDSITQGGTTLYVALRRITRKHWRVLLRRPVLFVRYWTASRIKSRTARIV
jgi:glycosyltransferase involved in cell wall biosynthesis